MAKLKQIDYASRIVKLCVGWLNRVWSLSRTKVFLGLWVEGEGQGQESWIALN